MAPETPMKFEWRLDIELLIATIMAPSMVFMVSTALCVALPGFQHELDATGTNLIWIVKADSLLQAAFIFQSGSFGDHDGRTPIGRRSFLQSVFSA